MVLISYGKVIQKCLLVFSAKLERDSNAKGHGSAVTHATVGFRPNDLDQVMQRFYLSRSNALRKRLMIRSKA
jgi:hypothetical protein